MAVRVINHLGDEAMKVFSVRQYYDVSFHGSYRDSRGGADHLASGSSDCFSSAEIKAARITAPFC
jgi:hypothetical protein